MSTSYLYFSGPCKWAKVYDPDDFNGEKKWKIDVFLNKAGLKDLKDAGLKLKVKEDDEGNRYVTFNRPVFKEIKGELKEFDPPRVLDKDGKTPITDLIGNDSIVTVKVQAYDTTMGMGHRLEAIRVDELKKYEKQEQQLEWEF
jgi:hypothetical protein